jgi:hypothetical protein
MGVKTKVERKSKQGNELPLNEIMEVCIDHDLHGVEVRVFSQHVKEII